MAVYIPIRKVEETPTSVDYAFEDNLGNSGLVRLNKASGDVELLKALPGTKAEEYLARVIYKLTKHWEKGEIPDATCWAS
ncbi:MAG TPA: hypothetical protein VIW92_04365 [Thermoanaerobaculia bacterium]